MRAQPRIISSKEVMITRSLGEKKVKPIFDRPKIPLSPFFSPPVWFIPLWRHEKNQKENKHVVTYVFEFWFEICKFLRKMVITDKSSGIFSFITDIGRLNWGETIWNSVL